MKCYDEAGNDCVTTNKSLQRGWHSLVKVIPVFVLRILPSPVTHGLMVIAQLGQPCVTNILVDVKERTGLDGLLQKWFDDYLLHIGCPNYFLTIFRLIS